VKILVTGAAGFIGFHTVSRLIERGDEVLGLDSVNTYYDINLKYSRLAESGIAREEVEHGVLVSSNRFQNYRFVRLCLEERDALISLFEREKFDVVCHLAAQAGVRYSLENPHAYIDANVVGFMNILENCRRFPVRHLVYASSSSVYGLNETMPFSTAHPVDHPISLYAATKRANELMAHTYSYLYGIPSTGLRFFTVYGPWGRPDMALFLYTKAILEGRPINVYNYGEMRRDFTYVDDIVAGVVRILDHPPSGSPAWRGAPPDPASSPAPYRIYNMGSGTPVRLSDFIDVIEEILGKKAQRNLLPMQPGDVPATWADIADLARDIGYCPTVGIKEGITRFIEWYRAYYRR